MKSVRCIHCGLINWADAEACKRCGKPPQAAAEENFGGWAQDAGHAPAADDAHGTDEAHGVDYAQPTYGRERPFEGDSRE
jgi:hypothetical protein